ncbi:MAG: hypothetical protein U0S76_00255 [Pseudoxanthomonas sp.]|nr:hypothetical protein [Pseudoxanthomonas sp.]
MTLRPALLLAALFAFPLAAAPPAGVRIEHQPAAAQAWPQARPPVIVESLAADGTVVTFLDGWGMERLDLVVAGDLHRLVCSGQDSRLSGLHDFRRRTQRAGAGDDAR